MRTTDTHIYFYGSVFSNWYMHSFEYGIQKFNCSEQAFMYHKAMVFKDYECAKLILNSTNPADQKKLGRQVKNYDDAYWNSMRYRIMKQILYSKFYNQKMRKILFDTGTKIIVEASPYDTIWGVGLSENDDRILDEKNWRGQNLLGKALMETRKTMYDDVIYEQINPEFNKYT